MAGATFLVSPKQIRAKLGEDVHFPCPTQGTGISQTIPIHTEITACHDMSGGAVITWSWNGRLVSAGSMRVYTDERIVVREEGRDLLVREVSLEDRGEWSCTVQLKQEPVSLAHRLEILVAPSISLDHSQVRREADDSALQA